MKSLKIIKKNKIFIKRFKNKKNLLMEILSIIKNDNLFLISGGKTFSFLFEYLSKNEYLLENKFFFLTDERITKKKENLNYHNIKNFFKGFIKKNFDKFFFDLRKIINSLSFKNSTKRKLLRINSAFIGVGHDGHIASIFNKSVILKKRADLVYLIKKKNENFNRITLSMKYISNISNIFIIVYGKKKSNIINILKKQQKKKLIINDLIKKSKKNIYIYYI